jgi:hypothetical protein
MDPMRASGLVESLRWAIYAHAAFVFAGLLFVRSAISDHTRYLRQRDKEMR